MTLLRAYAKWQTKGRTDTQIDINGTTDWYRQNFLTKPALDISAGMSVPRIIESTRSDKGLRISTLMCPVSSISSADGLFVVGQ